MSLPSLTITITDQRIVDGWVSAAIKNNTTPEDLMREFLDHQGQTYADLNRIGLLTSGAFIKRFTAQEYGAILAAADQSPEVAALVDELTRSPLIPLDDPRLKPGLLALVAANLLKPERVPELLSYDRPEAIAAAPAGPAVAP